MRKLLFGLILFGAPTALAQETYTLAATAPQVNTVSRIVAFVNEVKCSSLNLTPTCTQAEVCTVRGISPCTTAAARAAGQRIYPLTQAGREEFITDTVVDGLVEQNRRAKAREGERFCRNFNAASPAGKDAICAASGLAAGCDPCP